MKPLSLVSLALVLVLVSLSAYLRLAHSGVGCADWPACYGRIGTPPAVAETGTTESAYSKLVDESEQTLSWTTPLHRLIASVLGLLIFFLFIAALRRKRFRWHSAALLGLTVFLAVIGIRSGSLHDPAIVMGNLLGGFAMLGLLGWMVFTQGAPGPGSRQVATWATVAVIALCFQIFLGGLTSANFAALSCQTLPDCHGGWWPDESLMTALDLSREHIVTDSGQAVGGPERIAIHRAHRLGAILALTLALVAAIVGFTANQRYRPVSLLILGLVVAEFSVGIAAVVGGIPIGLALSHNALAAILLLALLRLLSVASRGETPA